MSEFPGISRDSQVLEAIQGDDVESFDRLMSGVPNPANGRSSQMPFTWLDYAIDLGAVSVVEWLIKHGANLNAIDGKFYPPLHRALEGEGGEAAKYAILELLIQHGADVNIRGMNAWTPAHLAAVRKDLRSLKLLVEAGADLTLTTIIDNDLNPLDEARALGSSPEVVAFLEEHTPRL